MHILDGTDCAQLPSVTNNYIVCAHIPILVQGIQEHMLASVQSLSLSLCSYRLLEPGALLWCQCVCLGYHWDDVHLQMGFQIMHTIWVQLSPNVITACLCMLACSILWCRYGCRPHIAGIVVGY